MIKEIQEEPFQEQSLNKENSKNEEPSKNYTNPENQISKITSDLNKLTIDSEVSKSPKKESTLINKDKEEKNNKEEIELEPKQKDIKKNLTLSSFSSLISNDINTNNQIKTPLRQDSVPFNFKQKAKVNFQEKSNIGTGTGNEYKIHRNSNSMRSPIYSYFDESQRFLCEQYSEENLLNLTRRNNKTKTLSNKEIKKKINKSANSEIKNLVQPKLKKSNSSINKEPKEENEIETPNYNDFNLFTDSNMSPEYYNMSQISNGLNLYGNKFSRKLSQATGSYKEGNSAIKLGNYGTFGDNETNDLNSNLPLNENNNISNEENFNNYINVRNNNIINEEIPNQGQIINNQQIFDNSNLLLGNLGNPGLSFDNNNLNKRNILNYNDYINNLSNQFSNNEMNNINNIKQFKILFNIIYFNNFIIFNS